MLVRELYFSNRIINRLKQISMYFPLFFNHFNNVNQQLKTLHSKLRKGNTMKWCHLAMSHASACYKSKRFRKVICIFSIRTRAYALSYKISS